MGSKILSRMSAGFFPSRLGLLSNPLNDVATDTARVTWLAPLTSNFFWGLVDLSVGIQYSNTGFKKCPTTFMIIGVEDSIFFIGDSEATIGVAEFGVIGGVTNAAGQEIF